MRNLCAIRDQSADLGCGRVSQVAVDSMTGNLYVLADNVVTIVDSLSYIKQERISLSDQLVGATDVMVSMVYLFDDMQLWCATKSGAIMHVDAMLTQVESVGQVPSGIGACAWSPDLTVLVVCSEDKALVLMNRDYDVIGECVLDTKQLGEDQLVTVGWGKKETQFQGSAGKQAALIKPEERTPIHDWDDRSVRITWRGDAQFFATSSVQLQTQHRVIRVWTRDGVLSSTLRPVAGIEHSLTWRPSGNWICVSAHRADRHEMVLFERNGEIRHNFSLRRTIAKETVYRSVWSNDSAVLAICVKNLETSANTVELWTCANYHWYRKQQFSVGSLPVVHCEWDVEKEHLLHICTESGSYRLVELVWHVSTAPKSDESATVLVVDGDQLNITSMAKCVVPPPMCQHTLDVGNQIKHVVRNWCNNACLLVLTDDQIISVADLQQPTVFTKMNLPPECLNSFLFVYVNDTIYCLKNGVDAQSTTIHTMVVEAGSIISHNECKLCIRAVNAVVLDDKLLLHASSGQWERFDEDSQSISPFTINDQPVVFAVACGQVDVIRVADTPVIIGLNHAHQLYIQHKVLASNVNSYVVHDNHLLVTTLAHKLYCIPFADLNTITDLDGLSGRALEIGSRLVVAVDGACRVVLQMPRGNLETIEPRPLLLALIRRLIENRKYADAFRIMKKHRINLNFLYDCNPEMFMLNLKLLLDQLNDAALFNLFLMELSAEDVVRGMYNEQKVATSGPGGWYGTTASKKSPKKLKTVDEILTDIRKVLDNLQPASKRASYITSVICTLIKADKPDLDEALCRVAEIRKNPEHSEHVSDALRHLLYSCDAEHLFDRALATHDFDLVLLVAERSHKDPKEYLPFLNELRRLPADYMAFRIECHLERPKHAVQYMQQLNDEHWPECVALIEKHQLYPLCLAQFDRSSERYKSVCQLYGKYLHAHRQFVEASILYERSGQMDKAIESAESGNDWRRWSRLTEGIDQAKRSLAVDRMAKRLMLVGQHGEAVVMYLHHRHFSSAIECYCATGEWTVAHAVASEHEPEKNVSSVSTRLLARCDELKQLCDRVHDEMSVQAGRLVDVRRDKHVLLEQWIEKGEPDWLADCDLYSQATSTISQVSVSTNKTAVKRQRKRDAAKRKASTKKGSKWEDLALMQSMHALVKQLNDVQAEAQNAMDCLLCLGEDTAARELDVSLHRVHRCIGKHIPVVWPDKWTPECLPGPLDQLYLDDNDQVDLPSDIKSAMPPAFTFESAMERPHVPEKTAWCKPLLHID